MGFDNSVILHEAATKMFTQVGALGDIIPRLNRRRVFTFHLLPYTAYRNVNSALISVDL